MNVPDEPPLPPALAPPVPVAPPAPPTLASTLLPVVLPPELQPATNPSTRTPMSVLIDGRGHASDVPSRSRGRTPAPGLRAAQPSPHGCAGSQAMRGGAVR
jgi:hypothetical protein